MFKLKSQLKTTEYLEFQICKKTGTVKDILNLDNIANVDDGSLYLEAFIDDAFWDNYGRFFEETNTFDGSNRFDCWGVNYYSISQTKEILKNVEMVSFEDKDILIKFLNAALDHNGFYILGV